MDTNSINALNNPNPKKFITQDHQELIQVTTPAIWDIFLTSQHLPVALINQSERIVAYNKAFLNLLDREEQSLKGLHIIDLFCAESRESLNQIFITNSKYQDFTEQCEYTNRSSSSISVQLWVSACMPDNFRLVAGINLNALQSLQTELTEYREQLIKIADTTLMMLWTISSKGFITYANPATLEFFSLNQEKINSVHWNLYVHPDDESHIHKAVLEAASQHRSFKIEIRLLRGDGQYRWVISRGNPLLDDSGVFSGILITSTDIHDRKIVEYALKESEENLKIVFNNSLQGIILFDIERRVKAFNTRALEYCQFASSECRLKVGDNATDVFPFNSKEYLVDSLESVFKGETVVEEINHTPTHLAKTIWFEMQMTPVFVGEFVNGVCLNLLDISVKKQAEIALIHSEERFRSLVQNSSDMVTILDANGIITFVSPSLKRILGYSNSMVGRVFIDYIHPDDKTYYQEQFEKKKKKSGISKAIQYRVLHASGGWRHIETISNNLLANQMIRGIVENSRDVSDRKIMEDQLSKDAYFDSLTDLPNRQSFLEKLEERLKEFNSGRTKKPFAIFFLDLDRFKVINDSLGHLIGDELLISISRRLQKVLDPHSGYFVARLGGDEFTVLVNNLETAPRISDIAEMIQREINKPINIDQHEVFMSCSIGIAAVDNANSYQEPGDLLRDADTAMYRAKSKGVGKFALFDTKMHKRMVQLLEIELEFRRALREDELCVHYQPIISLETNQVVSCEALVRWNHPKKGLIVPKDFLFIAHDTGMINLVDTWVMNHSLKQLSRWNKKFDHKIMLSLNVSVSRFIQSNFIDTIKSSLQKFNIAPEQLELELTEDLLIESASLTNVEILEELNQLGIHVCIDDFGTGYSSLAYLKRLPIKTVKIDRSFVRDIDTSANSASIVESIISLVHNLNMKVVAEGVETEAQLERLKTCGCDYVQGYLLGKPSPAREFVRHFKIDKLINSHQS